jgi:hypothetical protein
MNDITSTTPEPGPPHDEAMGADADLRDLWRFYARRMSDTALAVSLSLSILLIAAFAVVGLRHAHWALHWWPAALLPVFAGAFGAWGIADRELADRRGSPATRAIAIRMLVAVEWASCVTAAVAVAAGVMLFLRVTVGTWIS